jgi:hypothetical protein
LTEQLVSRADSKGLIEGFFNSDNATRRYNNTGYKPTFNLKTALQVVRNDPTVRAGIRAIVDKALENGWHLQGSNKQQKEELQKKLKELKFSSRILRPALSQLVLNGNVFLEIVKSGDKFKDLNLLEAPFVEIRSTENGDIIGYVMNEQAQTKRQPSWTPEEVTHIKMDNYSVNVWGEVDIQALYETVIIKDFARAFTDWLLRTNQFRSVFSGEGLNEDIITNLISEWKAAENDLTRPLPLDGKWEYKVLRNIQDLKEPIAIMEWCDSQILAAIGVPPMVGGKVDTSGRSNSDVQESKRLVSRVKAIQAIVEEMFSQDLFKKMGFPSTEFYFDYVDSKTITDALDIAEKMRKNLGFKKEVVVKYLKDAGLDFGEVEDPFDEDMEENTVKSMDSFQSRKGKSEGDVSEHNDEPSTRDDQLVSRTEPDKFKQYPYVY